MELAAMNETKRSPRPPRRLARAKPAYRAPIHSSYDIVKVTVLRKHYNSGMQIVLPGALPDPREARELASHLQKSAPTLVRWMEASRARAKDASPAQTGCTPYELWCLNTHGYTPDPGQNAAAGLGPLAAEAAEKTLPRDQPVWLGQLVHVAPSRDGAVLLPAAGLAITPGQSVALFESALALFADTGFGLDPLNDVHWRIRLPDSYAPRCASPELVSMTAVNDWWTQDEAGRPWRRLVNELQMLWFDHPVNESRMEQGQFPVNSVWLYGGGRANQFSASARRADAHVHDSLLAPAARHDWSAWLAELERLESEVFAPLSGGKTPELVLTGSEKIIETAPAGLSRWIKRLPGGRDTWRSWWSPQS
jgi:hypothetical protein